MALPFYSATTLKKRLVLILESEYIYIMITISITVERPLLKALDRKIREQDLAGRSEAIRQAIRDWLRKQAIQRMVQKEIQAYKKYPVKKDEFESLIFSQELP
jgi:metal-responsive CopG/Arc/MetJ family transcriptional regulator